MGAREDREYLERLFPEFKEFRDDRLRAQVLATWIDAWHRSGFRRLEDARFMPDTPKRSLVAHVRAVIRNSLAIADTLTHVHRIRVDRDMVLALAFLHDASKILENEKKKDGSYGKSRLGKFYPHGFLAAEIAKQHGVPEEICGMVSYHSPSIKFAHHRLESVILHEGDMADADALYFDAGVMNERLKKGAK